VCLQGASIQAANGGPPQATAEAVALPEAPPDAAAALERLDGFSAACGPGLLGAAGQTGAGGGVQRTFSLEEAVREAASVAAAEASGAGAAEAGVEQGRDAVASAAAVLLDSTPASRDPGHGGPCAGELAGTLVSMGADAGTADAAEDAAAQSAGETDAGAPEPPRAVAGASEEGQDADAPPEATTLTAGASEEGRDADAPPEATTLTAGASEEGRDADALPEATTLTAGAPEGVRDAEAAPTDAAASDEGQGPAPAADRGQSVTAPSTATAEQQVKNLTRMSSVPIPRGPGFAEPVAEGNRGLAPKVEAHVGAAPVSLELSGAEAQSDGPKMVEGSPDEEPVRSEPSGADVSAAEPDEWELTDVPQSWLPIPLVEVRVSFTCYRRFCLHCRRCLVPCGIKGGGG
jgi:hypothetical protein